MTDAGSEYRSIFLEPKWAHQAYFGWKVREASQGFQVLTKSSRGFQRLLVMVESSRRGGDAPWTGWLSWRAADIVVHDFGATSDESFVVGARRFEPLGGDRRLLNVATYVIDLRAGEDAISAAFTSDTRRKIRKAVSAGVSVSAHERPADDLVGRFEGAFAALASERSLHAFDARAYRRMYADGAALLYVVRQGEAELGFLHVYLAGPSAIFMTGVGLAKDNDGANHLLHWEIMRDLKARGVAWYDLGGVRSFESGDGITRFKKGFGGVPTPLGVEWGHRPRWVGSALALKNLVGGGAAARAPS